MNLNIKKVGKAVAGSALLVGATLTGAAGFAAAQNSDSGSMDLGDYPAPFVAEDGTVESSVVVGESAKTADVVGGINIAGSLSQAAFTTEEVSVGTGTAGSWSAENGITLNRQNSDLFLNDETDAEETRLDASDLNVLATTTFDSEDNEEVEVEHDVYVGQQNQNFNSGVGDVDDPVLHVQNPTNPESGATNNLFSAEVEFSETMDFTAAGESDPTLANGADEWIEDGDEIEMFGTEYSFSDESSTTELVFYGSSNRVEVDTGESATISSNSGEVTVESTFVSENGVTATVSVNGQTESIEEGDTVGPSGNIRISDIYRTGPDGQGRVAFSQGSNELTIDSSGDVEIDGDVVDGVQANVADNGNDFSTVDGITFYFGAADSDEDYVAAGEMYEAPLFGLEFHYGGLSGDVAENPAEAIEVEANEDGTASITVSDSTGDSADVTFVDNDQDSQDGDLGTSPIDLASDSGEFIATYEGEKLEEDDSVILNSNEEAAMYELTSVTEDLANADNGNGDVSVTLRNVVTGDTVTVEEDDIAVSDDEYDEAGTTSGTTSDDFYTLDSESIEGMDFDVTFYRGDDQVSFVRTGGETVQAFPNVYTESDAALTFTEEISWSQTQFNSTFSDTQELQLPSTVSSSDATVNLATDISNGQIVSANSGSGVGATSDGLGGEVTSQFEAGEVDYEISVADDGTVTVAPIADQEGETSGALTDPSAVVIQPEDDEDEEHAYIFTPDVSTDRGDVTTRYTGGSQSELDGNVVENDWLTADLDSEDNVEVGYNDYGAYTMYDSDNSDRDVFNLHLPAGQATSGLAVTGSDGSLSASGGSAGSVSSMTPAGWPDAAALDSEVTGSARNQDLVLVGGPAVNSLTQELAQEGKTMTADEYEEGQYTVQLVEDAFTEGNDALVVAGYAASDTRAASSYLANYMDNSGELSGQMEVTKTTVSTSQ